MKHTSSADHIPRIFSSSRRPAHFVCICTHSTKNTSHILRIYVYLSCIMRDWAERGLCMYTKNQIASAFSKHSRVVVEVLRALVCLEWIYLRCGRPVQSQSRFD